MAAPEQDAYPAESLRRMSRGYGVSLAFGVVSITFLGFCLSGLYFLRHGGDPMNALGAPGLTCFVSGFALLFVHRLILWKRTSPRLRNLVRDGFRCLFALLLLLSALAVLLVILQPAAPGFIIFFTVAAVLCQIGTVLWLFRYAGDL